MPKRGLAQGAHGLAGGCTGVESAGGWAGQSCVLVPWDMTAVAALKLRRYLPYTRDLGIK